MPAVSLTIAEILLSSMLAALKLHCIHFQTFDVSLTMVTSGGGSLGTDSVVRVGIVKNDSPTGVFSFSQTQVHLCLMLMNTVFFIYFFFTPIANSILCM